MSFLVNMLFLRRNWWLVWSVLSEFSSEFGICGMFLVFLGGSL